ncbi:recombinase family protein [Leptotrichia sp. HSP-536]|uniref:Recombinase family protein n=1 Tax=Leptotrichia alba TaxID=3239304 RepID=A0AB39V746_9FUSO
MKFGYARVSTAKQDLTRQVMALGKYGCDEVYSDVQSGKNMKRAELQKILSKIRENDTFVVTDIDRLGRNFTEVTELYTKLKDMKVNIAVINQELLNHNVNDRKDEIVNVVVIPLLIYLAERERSTLIERINDGIKNMPVGKSGKRYSRKTGNVIGRPVKVLKLSKEEQDMLKRVRKKEISVKSFCRFMQISRSSYYKYYRNSYPD